MELPDTATGLQNENKRAVPNCCTCTILYLPVKRRNENKQTQSIIVRKRIHQNKDVSRVTPKIPIHVHAEERSIRQFRKAIIRGFTLA